MNGKSWALAGVTAPIVYLFATLLGGAIRPGYSHVAQAISELTEAGAPNKVLLDVLFATYNVLLVAFGLGLLRYIRRRSVAPRRWSLGPWALTAGGAVGLAMTLFFPANPRDGPATYTGIVHLMLGGLLSLCKLYATLLIGLWLRKVKRLKLYGTYSLLTCVLVVLAGGRVALATLTANPLMGLADRLSIGAFLLWVFVLGSRLFTADF